MQPNIFDIAVLGFIVIFGLRGGLRGFIEEIAGLLGLAVGLILARTFFLQVTDVLARYISASAAPAISFVLLVVAGMLAVALVAHLLKKLLHIAFATWIDRLLGLAVGMFKGFLLAAALVYAIALIVPHFQPLQGAEILPIVRNLVTWLTTTLHVTLPMP